MADKLTLDIIIPLYNEAQVLPRLFESLENVFSKKGLDILGLSSVHYLFIDDGSTDCSANLIETYIRRSDNTVSLLRLSRNFGHQAAVTAGLEHSSSDLVGVIDADLQDPPEVLAQMIPKCREGADIVYGVRTKRKESIFKRIGYWSFYRLLEFLADFEIAIDSGDFCLMRRRAVDALCTLPEKIRFPRGLRSWIGFTQVAHPYERCERAAGRPKYRFKELYRLATDGIASVSTRPLKVIQLLCFVFAIILACILSLSVYQLFLVAQSPVSAWVLAVISLVSFSSFSILLCMHILSGYLARTYLEAKGRPAYLLREALSSKVEVLKTSTKRSLPSLIEFPKLQILNKEIENV